MPPLSETSPPEVAANAGAGGDVAPGSAPGSGPAIGAGRPGGAATVAVSPSPPPAPGASQVSIQREVPGEPPITSLNGRPGTISPAGAVTAARTGGPDAVMTYVVENARPGSTPGEAWDQLRAALARQFISKGDVNSAMHAEEYVFRLRHAGAFDNLRQAHALYDTNLPAAAQLLAKSHAFVDDGAIIGLQIHNNKLYLQRYDEQTHDPMGKAREVTKGNIREMMLLTENPKDFHAMVTAERTTNNTEQHQRITERQAERRAAETERHGRAEEDLGQQRVGATYAGQAGAETRSLRQDARARELGQAQIDARAEARRDAQMVRDAQISTGLAGRVDKEIADLYGADAVQPMLDMAGKPMKPDTKTQAGSIYQSVRTGSKGSITGPLATEIARSIVNPNRAERTYDSRDGVDPDGNPAVLIHDKNGNVISYLPPSAAKAWAHTGAQSPSERAQGRRG